MKCLTFTIVALLSLCAVGYSAETKKIPLDQIWAYKMPGTLDIAALSKNVPADELDMRLMKAVLELSYHRAERMKFKDVARPGFAVSGNGRSALHAALAVFIDPGVHREKFSSEDEITLVYFSEPLSRYQVQVREIKREDHEIEIRYELE